LSVTFSSGLSIFIYCGNSQFTRTKYSLFISLSLIAVCKCCNAVAVFAAINTQDVSLSNLYQKDGVNQGSIVVLVSFKYRAK